MLDPRPEDSALPCAVVLQNASNLRDLGGWPSADGRRVAMGRLYRAPALVGLSVEDEAAVDALGLRTVCDFRGAKERARNPVEIAGTQNFSLPIEPSVGGSLKDILRTGQAAGHVTPDEMLELLGEAYLAYALTSFEQYRSLFELILTPGRLPLLLHCSAGKDRTGFGSALVLTALGVEWRYVVQDYLATNSLWRRETARDFQLPEPAKTTLLGAHEMLLETAFIGVRDEYGSVDAYLDRAIGLDGSARAKLAALLLEA